MTNNVIKFHCPNCDKRLGVRIEEVHLSFVCPKCKRKLRFSEEAQLNLINIESSPAPSMQATTIVTAAPTAKEIPKTKEVPFAPKPVAPAIIRKVEAPVTDTASSTVATDNAPKRKFVITKKHS